MDIGEIGSTLMGGGFVDEGIVFEEMVVRVAKLEKLLASKVPVCPHCETEMVASHFYGYYDEFAYWACECEKIKNAKTVKGNYA